MQGFLSALGTVAGHPLALVAYVVLVGAWAFVIFRQGRLRTLGDMIKDIPEEQRAALIEQELSVRPRAGLSAPQWLENQKRNQLLVAFIATLIVLLLIISLAIIQSIRPDENESANLTLTASPLKVTGRGIVNTILSATVENSGTNIAEDVTIQLEMAEGIRITDLFHDTTISLGSLPGQISFTVTWDVEIDTFIVDEINIRTSARNSDVKIATIQVEGPDVQPFEDITLSYDITNFESIPDGYLAVTSPSRKEIVIIDSNGIEINALSLPNYYSAEDTFIYDPQRELFWFTSSSSSRVSAISLNDEKEIEIPQFPLLKDENEVPYSRTPLSLAIAPGFVACTSTEGEQCLWILDWPAEDSISSPIWRVIPYSSELTWSDFLPVWSSSNERLVLFDFNTIPASLSFYNPDTEKEAFTTLEGHDFENIAGMTAVKPLNNQSRLLIDEYGEHLSLIEYDGLRFQRTALTDEQEDWSDGLEKWTKLALEEAQGIVAVAVNVSTDGNDNVTSHIFTLTLDEFGPAELRGVWQNCEILDITISGKDILILCKKKNTENKIETMLRRISI